MTYIRRRPRRDLTHIGPALEQFLSSRPASPLDAILQIWPTVVSPEVAELAEPIRIDPSGTLLVRVSSAAMASELRFAAEETVQALRDALAEQAPSSVRFVTGSVPR